MAILKHTAKKIFREQVHLLFANSMVPIFLSVLAAVLLCWALQSVISHNVLTLWIAVFCIISAMRIALLVLFKREATGSEQRELWYWCFLIGTYVIAGVWGSAAIFLFPENSLSHQTVFFVIMIGMAASGISSLCPNLPVVTGFLSLALMPLIVRLMAAGSSDSLFNGSLILLFWVVSLFGAVKIHGNLRENIQLRLQSIDREKTLKVSEQRYRYIFKNAPLGIFHYDVESVIVDCNEEFIRILGSSRELLVGLNMLEVLQEQKMLQAIRDSLTRGEGYYEGDYTAVTSGRTTPVRVFFKAVNSLEQTPIGGVGIVEDFTEKKLTEEQIQYYASYDSLTGLPNRRLLLEYLSHELSRARRRGHYGALLFIDLDNFKTINDSLGHSVGDELLKVVAKRIRECIRQEDTAARMGGDEFIIIVTELDRSMGLAAHKARGIAEEISLCLSAPCQIEGRDLQITPSVGVSLFPKDDKGVDDILKQADTAMYRAKAAGRNAIHFFLPSMQEAADERLRLNTEIRKALEEDQFALYYQPQVDISGKLVGAEALLRWHHPQRGVVPPGAFLDIAEETGLMQDIGQWVLREACRHIIQWENAGLLSKLQTISINISGKEIAVPDFVDTVITVLDETGVDPNYIGIELTEGSLVSTGSDIVDKIMTLRQMGIKFSVDDFGTGYSSLSYLKSLPLNTLKIDRSFVNDIHDAKHDVVLVDTIIMMAQNLGMEVIAEGVETEQELFYLNSRGCVIYQGFYFSKPVPVESFTKMLESGSGNLDGQDACT
jgi:diguanylate cyclase (GGDEF)-like protein/PAS domain S-box-containing protein